MKAKRNIKILLIIGGACVLKWSNRKLDFRWLYGVMVST